MNRTNLNVVALLTGLCFASFADAAVIIFSEDFDTTAVGEMPAGWTRSQPVNTAVGVTDTVFVSSPNSLQLTRNAGATAGPAATASFETISVGVVTLNVDIRTETTVNDSLYVKMRNSLSQELGGVRFDNNGVFAYQTAGGGWEDTTTTYGANTWYSVQIDYDLETQTYSVEVDGSVLVADTPFRTVVTTFDAANVLFQSHVVLGTGSAFVDNVQVLGIPEPPAATMALMAILPLIAVQIWRTRRASRRQASTKEQLCPLS